MARMDPSSVKALCFDVFGTVVDWRSSIIREGEAFGKPRGISVDWADFADRWRAMYQPAMEGSGGRRGGPSSMSAPRGLGKLVVEFGLRGVMAAISEAQPCLPLIRGPTRAGLTRLKRKYVSPRCPTATSRSWSTWPSARDCRGTRSSVPR
jgi:2-haloacid dehalogenase